MITHPSTFFFWGKRNYIQGSHIIYGMLEAVDAWNLGRPRRFTASFREMIKEQGDYWLFTDSSTIKSFAEPICFLFNLATPTGAYTVGLVRNGKPVDKRVEDDEASLIAGCEVDGSGMILMTGGFPAQRLITGIVSLNKRLHQFMLPSEGFGPWILAKLSLQWEKIDPHAADPVRIRLASMIGKALSRSFVDVGGETVGEIYFNRSRLADERI